MTFFSNWATNVSFTSKQARAFTDVVMEKFLSHPDLNTYSTVYGGLVYGQKVPFIGRIKKVTKGYVSCGTGKEQSTIPTSEKEWLPNKARIWQSHCMDDLENTFWVYARKRGIERNDHTKAAPVLINFLVDLVADAAKEDAFRGVWFNDKDYVSTDLTGGAADLPYFNFSNGFWKRLFAIGTADADRRVTIAKNTNVGADTVVNYADQELDADEASSIYLELIRKADRRLKANGTPVILSTDTLFENYVDTLENKQLQFDMDYFENGVRAVKRRGVSIYSIPQWDEAIIENFDNGTSYDRPHRAVYTTKENLAIGMDEPNAVGNFEVWYNKDNEELNLREDYMIDTQIPFDYLVQVAY